MCPAPLQAALSLQGEREAEPVASRAFPASTRLQPDTGRNSDVFGEGRKILIFRSLLNECQALQGVEAVAATLSPEQNICHLKHQQHLHHASGSTLPVLLIHRGFDCPGHPHLLPDPPLPHHLPHPQEEDEEAENAKGSGGV